MLNKDSSAVNQASSYINNVLAVRGITYITGEVLTDFISKSAEGMSKGMLNTLITNLDEKGEYPVKLSKYDVKEHLNNKMGTVELEVKTATLRLVFVKVSDEDDSNYKVVFVGAMILGGTEGKTNNLTSKLFDFDF